MKEWLQCGHSLFSMLTFVAEFLRHHQKLNTTIKAKTSNNRWNQLEVC